jgi:sec-independent protein translocase protein TatC
MSFFEHLEELRKRLINALLSVAVGVGAGLYLVPQVVEFLQRPLMKAFREAGVAERLVFTSPLGPMNLYLTGGLYFGFVLASPLVLYQLWQFVAPGLYRHERRAVASFLVFGVLLFFAGTAFGYYLLLPATLRFLLEVGIGANFTAMISINEYFDLVLVILLGLGLVFQLPILIFFLSLFGIVTPRFLWNNFRYAVLVIAVASAVITPTTDVLTMSIFMAPMLLLYVVGIGVSAMVVRKKQAAAAVAGGQ